MSSDSILAYEIGQVVLTSLTMVILFIVLFKTFICSVRPNTFQSVYTLLFFFTAMLTCGIGTWNYRAIQFFFFKVHPDTLIFSGYMMALYFFFAALLIMLMVINSRFLKMLFRFFKKLVEEN